MLLHTAPLLGFDCRLTAQEDGSPCWMPLSAPGISGIWQTKKKETGLTKEEVSEVGIISDIFVCVVEGRARIQRPIRRFEQ